MTRHRTIAVTIIAFASTTALGYSGGSGTANAPYRIANKADLLELAGKPSDYDKHFVLTNDISLTGTVFTSAVIAPDMDPVTTALEGVAFSGTFDGRGHTIRSLKISAIGSNVGLFGRLDLSACVRNLGVVDADVTSTEDGRYVGVLVGYNKGSIWKCNVAGSVRGDSRVGGIVGYNMGDVSSSYSTVSVDAGDYAGGLVGYTGSGGNVTNSHSTGVVSGHDNVGGLVGYISWSTVCSSYSDCVVNGNKQVGGLIGRNGANAFVLNTFSTGNVSAIDSVGGLVGSNEQDVANSYSCGPVNGNTNTGGLIGFGGGSVTNSFWNIETSGRATSAGGTGLTTTKMHDTSIYLAAGWDFVNETFNGTSEFWKRDPRIGYPQLSMLSGYEPVLPDGQGTPEWPYLISNASELGSMWYRPRACYLLNADIELTNVAWSSAVIPWFGGVLDGNGHAIRNLHIDGGGQLGLAGILGNGSVFMNLRIEQVLVVGTIGPTGGLAGINNGSVLNCSITGSVTGGGFTGGLVGVNDGGILSCSSVCTVCGNFHVGGLVGHSPGGGISNCYSMCTVSGNSTVGGLVGLTYVNLSNSLSTGTVHGDKNVGGLLGCVSGDSVSNCYSTTKVTGNESVGGLVGLITNEGTVSSSFWNIDTSTQAASAGGTGLTTAQMQDRETYLSAGWDFVNETANGICDIWQMDGSAEYPQLSTLLGREPVLPDGTGTPESPYLIATGPELGAIWYRPHACYRLEKDIDLSGMLWATPVIPWFTGEIDGNAHVVQNLRMQASGRLALCGSLGAGGTLSRIGLERVSIVGTGGKIGSLVSGNDGTVFGCYCTGSITGGKFVGGLIGYQSTGVLSNSYSGSTVMGNDRVGGLVGYNGSGLITSSYHTGMVGGSTDVGGLVGYKASSGRVSNSFWDTETSGQAASAGGMGLPTTQMQNKQTYLDAGWDFMGETANGKEDIWRLEGRTYPQFAWQPEAEPLSEGFEGGFAALGWTLGSWPYWRISSAARQSGSQSAQAGAVGDDEQTSLSITLNCMAGKIRFWRKVSCESNWDYLEFFIDGSSKAQWSGESDWQEVAFPVKEGKRTFTWTYSKDSTGSAGADTAWIDDITFPVQ